VTTVSVAYPDDFIKKIEKAKAMAPGFKYFHIHSPCPTGWRFPESETIHIARLAVETGFWTLYEIENGSQTVNYRPEKRKPVEAYLNAQGRFKGLPKEGIQALQKWVDERWEEISV
jgi:pyruvate ferredoxin oxidoreductase beta subunit